jgi:hypothetical protein
MVPPQVRVTEALARYRQGHIEDAAMAMRQARLSAHNHVAAAAIGWRAFA